ncbi:OmpA/MotB domain protein [Pseudodesulfovibrio mercurii]|uniref:OmpA/MotB domain protein n=1 Tax=Pseudodesulfovibrio mercurii TaxID=641491 RepID=F0JJ38_9BACT|nr:flagellar motor protein MotB [Pseudodesulfovibrio mercurii]EGB15937.1 OmpA/MotB domain protein [Pseudodesulfovibrio mercurii]
MAKKKQKRNCEEMPLWMVTFADCMTLMLTFFILLVSMATIDQRRKLVALGSIIGTFGFNQAGYDTFSQKDTKKTVEPGPIDTGDLEPLQSLKWENVSQDINFSSSRFVQILSINASLLFGPDGYTLSPEGRATLDRFLPLLEQVKYPLLLAGHTSDLRDELGMNYQPGDDSRNPDLSWKLSLNRTLAIYRYLLDKGMSPDMLRVEGFGKYRPHYPPDTPENRARNRRVDIVLDKRSSRLSDRIVETMPVVPDRRDAMSVDGFEFDVSTPKELQ